MLTLPPLLLLLQVLLPPTLLLQCCWECCVQLPVACAVRPCLCCYFSHCYCCVLSVLVSPQPGRRCLTLQSSRQSPLAPPAALPCLNLLLSTPPCLCCLSIVHVILKVLIQALCFILVQP